MHTKTIFQSPISQFYFRVLLVIFAHYLYSTWMRSVLSQEPSSHCKNKTGDGAETKETELDCGRDSATKEQKVEKAEGKGLCQAHCSNWQ